MRDLAGIQKDFLNSILTGDNKPQPPAGPSEAGEFSAAIYRDLVAANHLGALKDVYPVCLRLLGENYFSFLAWNYLKDRPTDDPDLNRYGHDFPDFLEHEAGVREELGGLDYLAEVSRFEWSLYTASRTDPELIPLESMLSKLMSLGDKDTVLFRINPSLSLLKFNYPVARIWEENRLPEVGEIVLEKVMENVVVWKNKGDVLYETVDDDTFNLLKLVREGVRLSELNNIFADREQELERLISLFISSGWIADVETAGS
ncbi:MAG: putative DNA-binding domain-containing protein [Candidatus Dadabacteria bacterium]|nr:putative DNA-binding domain-containing protein [Candidatus Dadabacteria bacterium]